MLDSSIHRMKFKEYYIEHIKFMCVDLFEFLEDVGLIHLTSNQFVVLKLRHLLFLFLKFLWICLKICFWLFAIFLLSLFLISVYRWRGWTLLWGVLWGCTNRVPEVWRNCELQGDWLPFLGLLWSIFKIFVLLILKHKPQFWSIP